MAIEVDVEVESAVSEVTVFPDGALVTRRGSARIEQPGEQTLRIGGLPLSLQADSLRANGQGPEGTRLLGVELEREFHPAAPEEPQERLREAIRAQEMHIALLDSTMQMIQQQEQWLRTLGEQSARSMAWGVARGSAHPEDVGGVLAYTRDETQRLVEMRITYEREHEQAHRDLKALLRERSEHRAAHQPDRNAALVRLIAPEPGEITIALSYLVHGASWSPRYDARVDVAGGAVRLTQQALVSQQTGEDWPAVTLALSTARPSAAMRLPDEPEPWYLDVAAPPLPVPPRAGMRAPLATRMSASRPAAGFGVEAEDTMDGAMVTHQAMLMSRAPVTAPFSQASAMVEASGAARVFRLPGRGDVPSDGQPHTLSIGEYDLPCRFEYVAEPSVAAGAHLRAMARNSTGQALLPGALHVFHAAAGGDEYAGQTQLELTAEDAELPLYLGVDDNVTVKRDMIERETERGGLLQGSPRKLTLGYRVKVANHTAAAQRVVLKDALPLTRHERIKVRTLDIQPQPASRSGLDQLTWELTLMPGDEREVHWRVQVESPAGMDVTGLP